MISPREALEKLGLSARALRPFEGTLDDLGLSAGGIGTSSVKLDSYWEIELSGDHTPNAESDAENAPSQMDYFLSEMDEVYGVSVRKVPTNNGLQRGFKFVSTWNDVTRFAAYAEFGPGSTLACNVADKAEKIESKVIR